MIIVADSHGNELNPDCAEAISTVIADFKPKIRIHLGDAWNLAALRRGADEVDQGESIKDDFIGAENFLRSFFKGGEDNYYLHGNHDAPRLEQFARSPRAMIREAAEDGLEEMASILRRNRCTVLPYDSRLGVLRLGHLKAIHGYAHGINAARIMARVYGNVVMGHVHTIETVPVESIDGPSEARVIGAACNVDQPYNARQVNKLRHENGFAYGYLFDDGSYVLFQARRINGRMVYATDFKGI